MEEEKQQIIENEGAKVEPTAEIDEVANLDENVFKANNDLMDDAEETEFQCVNP
jgi:hypothetical protein